MVRVSKFNDAGADPVAVPGKYFLWIRSSDGALILQDDSGGKTVVGLGGAGNVTGTGGADKLAHWSGANTLAERQAWLLQDGNGASTLMLGTDTGNVDYTSTVRFTESSSTSQYVGGFVRYNGSFNGLIIGVHDTSGNNEADDISVIRIARGDGAIDYQAAGAITASGNPDWNMGTGLVTAREIQVSGIGVAQHGIWEDASGNVIVGFDSNDYISIRNSIMYMHIGANWEYRYDSTSLSPYTDNANTLGTAAWAWAGVYTYGITALGDITLHEGEFGTPSGGFGRLENKLTYSEQLDHADWTKTETTIVADDAASPSGETTADKLTLASVTGGTRTSLRQAETLAATTTYTVSFWAKKTSGDFTGLSVDFGDDDPQSMTITSNWKRYFLTGTTGGTPSAWIDINVLAHTGGVDDVFHLWGVQLEAAATAGPYVRTTAEELITPKYGLVANGDIHATGSMLLEPGKTIQWDFGSNTTIGEFSGDLEFNATQNLYFHPGTVDGLALFQLRTDTSATYFEIQNNSAASLFKVDGAGTATVGGSAVLVATDIGGTVGDVFLAATQTFAGVNTFSDDVKVETTLRIAETTAPLHLAGYSSLWVDAFGTLRKINEFGTDVSILESANIGVTVQAYDATILVDADIGVNVQGYDATMLVDADIGVTVQAYDADLDVFAGLASTDGNFIVGSAGGWVVENGATARTSIGLGTGDNVTFTDITGTGNLAVTGNSVLTGTLSIDAAFQASRNDRLQIHGTNASDTDGPNLGFYTPTSTYPIMHIEAYEIGFGEILFDAYYESAAYRSSSNGANASIYKNSTTLEFNYDSGVTAGSTVIWNTALAIDLTSGITDFKVTPTGPGLPIHKVKTADESITNETMQNDDDLFIALAANSYYTARLTVIITASTIGDIKMDFTMPASAVGFWQFSSDTGDAISIATGTDGLRQGSGADEVMFEIDVICYTAGTAGNLQFRWARNSTNGTTIVKRGSSMTAWKVG